MWQQIKRNNYPIDWAESAVLSVIDRSNFISMPTLTFRQRRIADNKTFHCVTPYTPE